MPGHITGFFRIYDADKDPLLCGSIGAGFSVEIGTLTTVSITEQDSPEIITIYNDEQIDAQVTKTVVQSLIKDNERTFKVLVSHESSLPSGVGFGASGAGALGTALALGHILAPSLSSIEAAAYAHRSEVVNRTGLGDVIAQTQGGLEIRIGPGAPGIGKIVKISHSSELKVVLAGAPGLETKAVLTNPESRRRINAIGDRLVTELVANQKIQTFIKCSREFTHAIGLATTRVNLALEALDASGFSQSSMVMLGDSVFCFCDDNETESVVNILSQFWAESQVSVTSIAHEGGRLVSW